MHKKVQGASWVIIIMGTLMILFLILSITLEKSDLTVDMPDFIIEGMCTIFAVFCFLISLKSRIKLLSIGWALLAASLLTDAVDEIKDFVFPDIMDIIIQESFLLFGIILVTLGFSIAIKENRTLLEELRYIALRDGLTNLPNRRFMKQKLTSDIKRASKSSSKIGILFIDLDKFKLINDTLGHSIGDHLLKKAAIRLNSVVIKENTIGRLGGDEFIVVLNDVKQLEEVEIVAKKILNLFREPFILREKQIHNTCSIGISVFPENGHDVETLFKNADIAMNISKEKGRDNYRFYSVAMNQKAEEKLEIVENLREALKQKEFIIHYQPKVNIKTGKITGLEALIRWRHPSIGLIYPDHFIYIAEEAGIINAIDELVFEAACLQIKSWINNGFSPINIAVNISPTFFSNIEFITKLEKIIKETGVDASYLSVEITETAAMKNTGYVHSILNRLRENKIEISLDDFGTGYSSLSYLKIFPIDTLKIDRLFVNGINKDKRDESLIEATITMAKALGIKVISEGVETKKQLQYLKEIGCEEYQGYLFSKPAPIEEIEDVLRENRSCSMLSI